MRQNIFYKLDKLSLILLFLLFIYIPFINGVITEDQASSGVEKRNLVKLPSFNLTLESLANYPKKFTAYYSDHFGYREKLTKAYFKIKNKLGSETSTDDVTVGQNGWLFLGSIKPGYQKYKDPMGDAINANLFTANELKDFADALITIRNWLKNRGIEYIYVIAPNKHTIYFEQLPKYISKINPTSAADQIVKYLKENTDILVVDLRLPLLKAKKENQLYFKTDTHWNQRGANIAQFEIMKKIKILFPKKIKPSLHADNQFQITLKKDGDLARLSKIEFAPENNPKPVFQAGCIPINETQNIEETMPHTMVCADKKVNTVIFRDSFFSALQPYISRQFHRSTYIWSKINYNLLATYIDKEKPDIVIDEVVERVLPYIPSTKAFPKH